MARRSYYFAAATTALTFLLILLGEFTAVSGSGATCSLEWPYCNGQLLPFGLPLHDFIEWLHRFVAMIVGFLILGTGVAAWRNFDARDVRIGGVVAVVLLPTQVLLGGATVTFSGLFPGGYSPPLQAAHHVTALGIFTALVYTTLRMREQAGLGVGSVRTAALVGLAALPLELAFSRNTIFAVYGTRVQLAHHAFELVAFGAAVAVVVWARRRNAGRAAAAGAAAAGVTTVQVLLGTGLVQFSTTVQLTYYALAAVVAALFVVLARRPVES